MVQAVHGKIFNLMVEKKLSHGGKQLFFPMLNSTLLTTLFFLFLIGQKQWREKKKKRG
jgi:hypothetical protein